MNTESQGPAALILVRRAGPPDGRRMTSLLGAAGADPQEVAELLRQRGVLVLIDVSLPPAAPPLAAAAFRIDDRAGAADLVAIAVREPWRRRGLGRRLLRGALTLLRAEGLELVRASSQSPGPGASLLVSAGFAAHYTADADGRSQFQLLL